MLVVKFDHCQVHVMLIEFSEELVGIVNRGVAFEA